jgi:23S rRNA (pseudouridine1915-N3)-methyltransferase
MNLIAIGRLRAGPELELFERYNTRMRPKLTVTELPEERGAPSVVKRKETAALLAALPKDAFVVAMDLGGKPLTSEAFAARLQDWSMLGKPLCFLIGGAEGLDQPVIARADFVLSLGAMTWPHFLVRPLLAEQLYRAQAIAQSHPYHRAGRPEG